MWHIDLNRLEFIDKRLRDILRSKDNHFGSREITSLYRIDDPGVHGQLPLRGVDERCPDQAIGDIEAEWVNRRWIYDPDRPDMKVCVCHDVGQGLHLHYQVHPNTIRRS